MTEAALHRWTASDGVELAYYETGAGRPVDVVFRGVAPFLIPLITVLIVVTALPDVVLWLPGLLGF